MKNYAEMSDFEINAAVHNHVKRLGYDLEFLGCDRIKWSKRGADDVFTGKVCYSKNTVTDYCNNWAGAGPIMLENRISLLLADESIACAYSKNVYDEFGRVEGYEFEVEHKNPLRAAMIVFLMMKDDETRILAPDEVSDE